MKNFIFLFFLLAHSSVWAQEASYFSFKLGAADIKGSDHISGDANMNYDIGVGLLATKHISAGFHLSYFKTDLGGSASGDITLVPFLLEMNYYLMGADASSSFYLGWLMGGTYIKQEGPLGLINDDDEANNFTLGAKAGWSINLGPGYTVFPEFTWMHIYTNQGYLEVYNAQIGLAMWF